MTHFNLTERLEHLQNLEGNFTLSPTYLDLITGVVNVISWYYGPRMWTNYKFPQSFIDEFTQYYYFPIHQALYIVYIAILITILRYIFEKVICKIFVDWLDVKTSNKKKFPESAWKCFFYTCTWTYNVYLLNFRYDYFREPYLIWDDWSAGMAVPFDIQLMYFIQCGFYLHSIYGTLYMDNKRKDFYAMLIHHVITMTLIFVSYATRYHKIGLLVLFVHDITDIWLELAKALHYLSSRKDREYPFYETLANASSIMFVFCWFLFRIYWYPIKVLYSTGVVTAYRAYDRGCGLYLFFNGLLWLLLGLNIYWLYFILQFLVRTLAGANKGLQDTREDDDDDEETTTTTTSNSVKASVNKKEQ